LLTRTGHFSLILISSFSGCMAGGCSAANARKREGDSRGRRQEDLFVGQNLAAGAPNIKYMYMHVYIYTCTHTCMYRHIYVFVCVHSYVYIFCYLHTHIYTYICIYRHIDVLIYRYRHTHTYICIYMLYIYPKRQGDPRGRGEEDLVLGQNLAAGAPNIDRYGYTFSNTSTYICIHIYIRLTQSLIRRRGEEDFVVGQNLEAGAPNIIHAYRYMHAYI